MCPRSPLQSSPQNNVVRFENRIDPNVIHKGSIRAYKVLDIGSLFDEMLKGENFFEWRVIGEICRQTSTEKSRSAITQLWFLLRVGCLELRSGLFERLQGDDPLQKVCEYSRSHPDILRKPCGVTPRWR